MFRYFLKNKLINKCNSTVPSTAVNVYDYIARTLVEFECCDFDIECCVEPNLTDICLPEPCFVKSAWNKSADKPHFDWKSAIYTVIECECDITINDPTKQFYDKCKLRKYFISPLAPNSKSVSLKKLIIDTASEVLPCNQLNPCYKCGNCYTILTEGDNSGPVIIIDAVDDNIGTVDVNTVMTVVVDVRLNDTSELCEPISYIHLNPINCTVVNNNNGTFNVTPLTEGPFSFQYTACCSNGTTCDTATVSGESVNSGTFVECNNTCTNPELIFTTTSATAVSYSPLTVSFLNSGYVSTNATPTDSDVTINWGDGQINTYPTVITSTGGFQGTLIPPHVYDSPGVYLIEVSYLNASGLNTVKQIYIDIQNDVESGNYKSVGTYGLDIRYLTECPIRMIETLEGNTQAIPPEYTGTLDFIGTPSNFIDGIPSDSAGELIPGQVYTLTTERETTVGTLVSSVEFRIDCN